MFAIALKLYLNAENKCHYIPIYADDLIVDMSYRREDPPQGLIV